MEILTNSNGSFIKTYPIMYNGKMCGMIRNAKEQFPRMRELLEGVIEWSDR